MKEMIKKTIKALWFIDLVTVLLGVTWSLVESQLGLLSVSFVWFIAGVVLLRMMFIEVVLHIVLNVANLVLTISGYDNEIENED